LRLYPRQQDPIQRHQNCSPAGYKYNCVQLGPLSSI